MKCPYCEKEMVEGTLTGDGRSKVRWLKGGEKINLLDKAVTEKGCVEAKYSLTTFRISSCYCDNCKKLIINTCIKDY